MQNSAKCRFILKSFDSYFYRYIFTQYQNSIQVLDQSDLQMYN